MKSVQGFLFDRIECQACDASVVCRTHYSSRADTSPAESSLTFGYLTMSETDLTSRHRHTPPRNAAGSIVPYHFEPLQLIFLMLADTALTSRDIDLLLHGIHSVQIGQQKSSLIAGCHDHAVTLNIQFIG